MIKMDQSELWKTLIKKAIYNTIGEKKRVIYTSLSRNIAIYSTLMLIYPEKSVILCRKCEFYIEKIESIM